MVGLGAGVVRVQHRLGHVKVLGIRIIGIIVVVMLT